MIHNLIKQHGFNISLLLSAGLSTQPALSATDTGDKILPEVIVTADFRPEDQQNLPISLTAIGDDSIKARGAQHLEDIINLAPNVNLASGASRARFFQIRGIGERSEFAQPINPSVGLLMDGINLSGLGTAATMFDVEQVEILRGPQGTRFGANALAGIINIHSQAPTDEPAAGIEATAAEYDTQSLGLWGNVALIKNRLFARVAVQQYRADGFIKNTFLNVDDTNERDESTARARLRWVASDSLTVDLTLLHADIDNGYDAFSLDNNRRTLSDQPGHDSQTSNAGALNIDWLVNNKIKMKGLVSAADSDSEYSYDEDWTYVGIAPGWEYSSFDQYQRDNKNLTLEAQLLSDAEGRLFSDSTDWVVGLYHFNRETTLERNYTYFEAAFFSDYETTNTALFGQLDTALSERLTLITGLRVEQWEADYSDSFFDPKDPDETLSGGKLGLNFAMNEHQGLYIVLARGYKAGGVNTEARISSEAELSALQAFDTEFQTNLEGGIKSRWLDNKMRTRVSVFYAKRRDMQVKGSQLLFRDDGSTEFLDFIGNAAKGKNYGLEAEFDWLANEQWKLFGSLGLLRAELEDYNTPGGVDMSGRDQAHAPRYQYFLGSEHQFGGGIYFRTELEGKDAFYFSNRHQEKSNAYALINARLGYRREQWHVALWVRNLGDKEYHNRGFGFANDPRDEYTSSGYTQLGEPRVTGITVNWQM